MNVITLEIIAFEICQFLYNVEKTRCSAWYDLPSAASQDVAKIKRFAAARPHKTLYPKVKELRYEIAP